MMKNHNPIFKVLSGLLFLCCFTPVFSQEDSTIVQTPGKETEKNIVLITVKGHVRDAATKLPVLGAKVQNKDQRYSAITDENGSFSIQIPEYINQLYLSGPDYPLVIIPLQGNTNIEAVLYPSQFREYYEPQTSLYSKITVTPRNISALTIDSEIQSLLGGDMSVITHSGTPGIGTSMFIRGFNSLNAGSQPLIMVDGVIFDNQYDRTSVHEGFVLNPLANISADDIEGISVIKDGTSFFGSKGGNGILAIQTKRGRDMATRITASSMFGYNERPQTIPLFNATQFRVYVSDMAKSLVPDPSYLSALPFLNDNPSYFDYKRYHNDNDWSNNVYRNSSTHSYNVGVSGGDNVALYHLSMGYANAQSTLKANDFSRFNARFNSDIDLTSKFKFSFDLSYSQTDRNLRNDGFSEVSNAIISPSALALIKAPFLIPYEYSNTATITTDLSDEDFLDITNPVAIIDWGIGKNSQNYLSLSLRPSYRFNNALTLSGLFNYSMHSLFESFFRPDKGVATIELPEVEGESRNYVQGQNAKQISISSYLYLNWEKQIAMHHIGVTGGLRFLTDSYKGEYGSGHNTSSDLDHNLNGSLSYRTTTGYDDAWRSLSWYVQANYSLYDKYLLSATATADASSRFGKDADLPEIGGVRWRIFPEVNAAWLVSSENFMANLPFVNMLKLRVGYGLSGNDNIPGAAARSYFGSIRYINQYTGKTLSNIGNTFLKPETVKKTNAGIDINLLHNRLSLSGSWYHNVTSDLLTLKQFNYISGMESYWTNDGKLQNNGFELSANLKALNLNYFQLEFGGSVSHYVNKILELPDGDYLTPVYGSEIITSVGKPAGLFYGYKTEGVFATTVEASEANLKVRNATGVGYTNFEAGDMHFVDLYEDGIIDEKDKTIIGDPNPDVTGTFNTRITYKKLSVNALFSFSYGNEVYNYVRSQLESGSNLYNQSAAMQNRWVSEGQQTLIPRSVYGDPMGNSRFSDRWIEDGSYLRFKTLTVAYEVPINWIFLSGFTVWASANNVWTYTKYLGSDPEFSISNSILYQGIDAGMLSQGKSYFVGLKLNL
jgi:TonB-linked SusC/RagA family outer membrane protein